MTELSLISERKPSTAEDISRAARATRANATPKIPRTTTTDIVRDASRATAPNTRDEYSLDLKADVLPEENPLEIPDEEILYELADLFKIFGDTTRIKILYALVGADLCVADIATLVGVTQSAVSHQLRILKQAHLVKFRRDGKSVVYSLSDEHVHTVLAQGMNHICE